MKIAINGATARSVVQISKIFFRIVSNFARDCR